MQYIHNLPDYIERLATTSIFDQNFNVRVTAEQELTNFFFELPPDQYEPLLEGCSVHVVLAFAAILLKNLARVQLRVTEILPRVNEILMRWYQANGTLRRQKGEELTIYVQNTFGQFMGNCLRMVFQRAGSQWREMLNGFLDGLGHKPHYRLFLYFRFIESFFLTSETTNYVEYRVLLTTFQEAYIPRIFEALFPYFISISDGMDVDQLSFLQGSLSIHHANNPKCVLQFSNKNRFTEMVFLLLEHVTTFRFNISSKEYEQMEQFQDVQISFPQELLVKVMKQSFLEALYSVLMQLMRTNEWKFQQTCLNCLQKILLAKITYITRDMQTRFIFNNMQGVLNLLKLILQCKVTNRINAVDILRCSCNFIKTFGLQEIDKKLEEEPRFVSIFREWLDVTRRVPLFLLNNDTEALDVENQLFMAAGEMSAEVAYELKINKVQYDKQEYSQYYREFITAFLTNFIGKGRDVLAGKNFSFDELKRASKEVLGNVKLLMTYNYHETFTLIGHATKLFFQSGANEISAGNLLLLIQELIREACFLQESVFGSGLVDYRRGEMEEMGGELGLFAEIVSKALAFILNYQVNQAHSSNYLANAMVIFLSALLERCSKKLCVGEEGNCSAPFINDELFYQMKLYQRGQEDEQFLLSCLFGLAKFLRVGGMRNIEFIFKQLYDAIITIKSNMRRDYFKRTAIYAQMLQLFKSFSQEPMPLQFMRWRALLFRIITVLSFDDALDEYRGSIRSTIDLIKISVSQQEWVKVLFDLTGIFQSIDGRIIFRYFVRSLLKDINMGLLIKELFLRVGFDKPNEYLKDVMRLSWYLVANYNNRVDSHDEVTHIYELLYSIIPLWTQFMHQQQFVAENDDSLAEIYAGFRGIIVGKHINLCLLDLNMPKQFRTFLKVLLYNMCRSLDTIESSTEIAKTLFALGLNLTTDIVKPLFNLDDAEVTEYLHKFVKAIMRKLKLSFESLAIGVLQQNSLQPMLKIIESYFEFIRVHHRREHLGKVIGNIRQVLEDGEGKAAFLEVLIKLAMEFRSNFLQTTQTIAQICVNLIKFYDTHIQYREVRGKLGLTDVKDGDELERIFKHIRGNCEDYEWLALQMKGWLTLKARFSSFVGDDY